MEHIERTHPLRVTLSQIVVHGYDVNSIACQCVQEDRSCTNEGLTLTGSHLGNLTLMQNDTTEELDVVVDHFPLHIVTAGCPVVVIDSLVAIDGNEIVLWIRSQLAVEVCSSNYSLLVLSETAGSILNDSENLRQYLIEGDFILVESFLLQLVNLVEDTFTLIDRSVLNLSLEFGNLSLFLFSVLLYVLLDFLCFCTEFVIAQGIHLRIFCLDFLYDWLDQLHIAS